MKRLLIGIAVCALVVAFASLACAQSADTQPSADVTAEQNQQEGWVCPWCGRAVGPGPAQDRPGPEMAPPGYGMGPGMMYGGYGMMGPRMRHYRYGWGMMPWRAYPSAPEPEYPGYGPGYGMGMMPAPGYTRPAPRNGHGMMHGDGWGRGWQGAHDAQRATPLSKDDAAFIVRNYIAGNPNLKVGEITDTESGYEASIVTKDDSLVERLLIDKQTGWVKPVY